MVSKLCLIAFLVALVSRGSCVTEIVLEDESYNYLTNELIGRSITIPKSFLDRLQSCHIVFPNGVIYEGYPNSNIPGPEVFFLDAVQPFVSCAVGFRGVAVELAGTYELISIVEYSADLSVALTRQKFHLNIFESSLE